MEIQQITLDRNAFSGRYEVVSATDLTDVFDEVLPSGKIRILTPPGFPNDRMVSWGVDNNLPTRIADLVSADEVTAQNKFFNVLTCYGNGVQLQHDELCNNLERDDVARWLDDNELAPYFIDQVTDMKFFYFAVAVIILSKDGRRITGIRHKDATYCRLAPASSNYGHIPFVYYADWANNPQRCERISVLNERNPLGDLRARLRREKEEGTYPVRKYAIIMRYPTVGNRYYPVPYWASILRGGSYDEKRLISEGKRARLRNATSVKYQIEIERGYWERICTEENIVDPDARIARVRREKENIRDFVCGIENGGKAWITGYYVDAFHNEIRDVRIQRIDTQKEGGDWGEDLQAAANTICYADNIHPSLVGATPGKSAMNNSGSDKRELFTMKQALEKSFRDILLLPLRVVCKYNGWDNTAPVVPFVQLTTLDKHTDAELKL